MKGQFIQKYLNLETESRRLQERCEQFGEELAELETFKWQTEEDKYVRLNDGMLKPITTIQAEIVETVSESYEPGGKTKEERAARLLSHVRKTYPEYNTLENTIQEVEHKLRQLKGQIASTTESAKANHKCLAAVQARIETVGKIIDTLS